ncbi:hypothetical protein O3G_MSEX008578 [Manduca sexta]|uniref:Uncharacterized protein n=1 Tax=Manduca sexta TaxID=7130 RepID=A0A921ZAY5_MANSE|nr:hypothetical protein O3G_MSEX008578 [Manduca sexta]
MCEKSLIFVFAIICLATAAPPSFITKCKKDDKKCGKESAQVALPIFAKGLAEDNVEQLDPVVFKKVDASTPNLKFILSDVTVTGLQNCKVKKLERDDAKIHIEFLCEAQLDGKYDLKGKLATLPIEGNGPMHVDLKETQIDLNLYIEDKKGDDGKIHWHITKWDHSFALKAKSFVKFDNLFDGNEVLGEF